MSSPLLRTKLYIPPPRQTLVRRPHLVQRLAEGQRLGRQLTLLSTPAGFGKTTLLSEWIHSSGTDDHAPPRVAWLTLDQDDNDPVRFLAYLVAAVQTVSPELGQMVQDMLGTSQPPPLPSLMTLLLNDMAAAPQAITLVLDDYHLVHADQVHRALTFLLDHQPPNLHLVVSTRVDPPLPLPRLRVRGHMTEIRAEDLRFTAEEAAAFLRQGLGLVLDPELVADLEARTEGWIAGLQLAALSMQGKSPTERTRFVTAFSGSHRHVIDYLAEEVLVQQPDHVRQFLRKTAILDRLCAPLCDALTGREDSDAILRHLEEANLFLVPLDDQREWYRYHRLFADFLSTDLDKRSRAALHRKAAHWLTSHDLLPEAVKHALASGDVDEAAHTIALAAGEALRSASVVTLTGWLDALPAKVVKAHSDLATYQGFTLLLAGQASQVASFAAAAERCLASRTSPTSRGRLDSLRAHIALFDNDFGLAVRLARSALEHLGEGDDVFRDLALNILGQALEWQGDVAAAAEVYREAARTGLQTGNQVGAMVVLTNLVFALNELGRRREAVALCQRIAEDGKSEARRGFPQAEGIRLAWSLLSLEANELEQAHDQVQQPLELCDHLNMVEGSVWGRYILARVHLAQGNLDALRQTVRAGKKHTLGSDLYPGKRGWFAALEAQASLEEGDLAAVDQWATTAGLSPTDTPCHWDELPYFVYVRLLIARNRLGEADALLATLERSAKKAGRRRKLITVYLQQALIQQTLDRKPAALANAERAVRLAAPEGYIRAFLDEGPKVAKLLPQVRHAAPDFVARLLAAFRRETQRAEGRGTADISPLTDRANKLIEPLTERETEILRLIAAGHSNPEIADQLYLSLNTVKWHVKNLYGKLQVSNRVAAAARADELGLLET